jgi:hypothetical protein
LLVALEPKGLASLGTLDARLGVRLAAGKLTDDNNFLPQKKTAADHRFVVTSKFSAHASTNTLSRGARPMVIADGGALEPVAGTAAKPDIVIRSMPTSFLDLDDDFVFDDGKEKRATFDLAAAVSDKFRAFVIADVDVFSDVLVAGPRATVVMLGGPLFVDVVSWLAGEELMNPIVDDSGETKPVMLVAIGPLPLRLVERKLCPPVSTYWLLVESVPFQEYQPLVFASNSPFAIRFGPTPAGALKANLSTLTPPLKTTNTLRSPEIGKNGTVTVAFGFQPPLGGNCTVASTGPVMLSARSVAVVAVVPPLP